jgi:hypothetical protein
MILVIFKQMPCKPISIRVLACLKTIRPISLLA